MSAVLKLDDKKNPGFQNDLDVSDIGSDDSLRGHVLNFVVNEEYERAVQHLKDYIEKESVYPNFKKKTDRYFQHAIDLIAAIKSKRNFPNAAMLTKSKQNELKEKYKEHFKELKSIMKKIENCQEELRLADIRSTTTLIKALWMSVVIVVVSAFIIEVVQGLGKTFYIVVDDLINQGLAYLYALFDMQ